MFAEIPNEILTLIFSYLPTKDKVTMVRVCKRWASILDNNQLWKLDFAKIGPFNAVVKDSICRQGITSVKIGQDFDTEMLPPKVRRILCTHIWSLNDLMTSSDVDLSEVHTLILNDPYIISYKLEKVFKKFPRLVTLTLLNAEIISPKTFQFIMAQKTIRYLTIETYWMHLVEVRELFLSDFVTQLRFLSISRLNEFDHELYEQLLRRCRFLKTLELELTRGFTFTALKTILTHGKHLKTLRIKVVSLRQIMTVEQMLFNCFQVTPRRFRNKTTIIQTVRPDGSVKTIKL
ncbi:uncharacterized protein LOC115325918 [Ixodes scapularis]|uniref:uncharacterized protein LOC115325918 n=1 Tax=Ixodes scapularis TaxID=6945 RepID=UPI001A9E708B|nr:uncharacterized protein LOC115325918 [Ixodes scapularis]